ncbi:MAG: TlpA family protein disulfide reductase [Myxococcales bacterium]|nr:TlpA family protein disulfide reductase [Myxococcales bacterium]MCB9533250.1 TlpA family protein disulfide reductase [Myxococcales bacterium]
MSRAVRSHRPVLAAAIWACAASVVAACDPGSQCDPAADAPEGVWACDPTLVRDGGLSDDVAAVDAASDGSGDAGVSRAVYPAGPYGAVEGAVIGDVALLTADGEPFALSDVRADESAHLLLLSTGAGWCTACREEQPTLVELHDRYGSRGLRVVVAIFEDDFSAPVTQAYAAGWRRQYGLPFTVLADEFNAFGAYYDATLAPMNMFVDLDTMEILRIGIGFDESATRAIINDRLP